MNVVQQARAARLGEPVDHDRLEALKARITENFNRQMDVFHISARVLEDGVIDPRNIRDLLIELMEIAREGDARRGRTCLTLGARDLTRCTHVSSGSRGAICPEGDPAWQVG